MANTEQQDLDEEWEQECLENNGIRYDWRHHEARDGAILVPGNEYHEEDEYSEDRQVNVIERTPTPGTEIQRLRQRTRTLERQVRESEERFETLTREGKTAPEEMMQLYYEVEELHAEIEEIQRQTREHLEESEQPTMEINMIEVRQSMPERDDGHHTRGRPPPPFAWEEEQRPNSQTPSPTMEPNQEEYPITDTYHRHANDTPGR